MVGLVAYVDESFFEHPTAGFYVLAAAVFDGESDDARQVMRGLRGGQRTDKLHWNEMDARQQRTAAQKVAELPGVQPGHHRNSRPATEAGTRPQGEPAAAGL